MNDIDLYLIECPLDAKSPKDPHCGVIMASEGSTDEEQITFKPKEDKLYAVRVDGVMIKDDGSFKLEEILGFDPEKGSVSISSDQESFNIHYSVDGLDPVKSKLISDPRFTSGKYAIRGELTIKAKDDTVLMALPVEIGNLGVSLEFENP